MSKNDWVADLYCAYCGNEWTRIVPKGHRPYYSKDGDRMAAGDEMVKGLYFAPELSRQWSIVHEQCDNCGCFSGVQYRKPTQCRGNPTKE